MKFPFGFTLTVLLQEVDRHGDRTPTSDFTISGCAFAPGGSFEDTDGRNQLTRRGTVYLPSGIHQVPATAKLVIPASVTGDTADTTWEVEGDKEYWRSPLSGWQPGSELPVKRVTG